MVYHLFIAIYAFLARIYALFNKKASLLVKGQAEAYGLLRNKVVPGKQYIWFHAASLGECYLSQLWHLADVLLSFRL